MLSQITLLTSVIVAVLYPLCFWISIKDPLKNNFHHFHLGLPTVIAALCCISLFGWPVPSAIKLMALFWVILLLLVCAIYWHKPTPQISVVTFAVILGLIVYVRLQNELLSYRWDYVVISLLAGLIFCAVLFAMNLGHWYLNVHGLSMTHLMRSTNVLSILLSVRLIWDFLYAILARIPYRGELIPIFRFMMTMEGFLICVGLFFGTLLPLISIYFVRETIKLKNTQSATGILYAILCAVVLGDIAYKYYLIKFGIAL